MSFVESPGPFDTDPVALRGAGPPAGSAAALRMHPRGDAARADVEDLIAAVYARHYGARIEQFMPTLVSLGAPGAPCAAAGYRSARGPLFLERYLPRPVERVLAQATGQAIRREQIVEVGQFASRRAGEGRRLMAALAHHLADRGYRWAVITATAELRLLFARIGLASVPLGPADPARLGAGAARWGSYYAHAPRVLAGELAASLPRLDRTAP